MRSSAVKKRDDPISPYLPVRCTVEKNIRVSEKERLFSIQPSTPLAPHEPGQFFMAGLPGYGEAPFSVSSPPDRNGRFELCIRRVGNLTTALHRLKKGDTVWIRGPFGRGFPVESMKNRDIIFIAGGIGIVPMRSLIKTVMKDRNSYGRLTLLYGVKTPEEILFGEEIEKWGRLGMDCHLTIDRPHPAWKGNVGVVTTLIPPLSIDGANTICVIVGPPVMYKYVLLSLSNKRINGHDIILSLERCMKCGLGKCGHCQINSIYVCQEGPVFRLSEIRHLREAL